MKCFLQKIKQLSPIPFRQEPTTPHLIRSVEVKALYKSEIDRPQERTPNLYTLSYYQYHGYYNDQYFSH